MSPTPNFDISFELLMEVEGGYVDDPNDIPTNYGVTQKTLSEWRAREVTKMEVRNLTLKEAKKIYKTLYWGRMRCGDMAEPLATIVFDQAVNRGTKRVSLELQKILDVGGDGKVGNKTLAALARRNQKEVAFKLLKISQNYYIDLAAKKPSMAKFLRGWINRTHKLYDLLFVS